MDILLIIGGTGVGLALLGGFWYVGRNASDSVERARTLFHQQREHLEACYFDIASTGGRPRGLRWTGCHWSDAVEFARDHATGQLTAIVGLSISFEAVAGSDMEGLPAVANLRGASALFVHDGRRWQATGRTVFNLAPEEVLTHFPQQFERV